MTTLRPRCVVLDGFTLTPHVPPAVCPRDEPSWGPLASLVDLVVHERTAPQDVVGRARDAELLLTNKVVLDRSTLGALEKLRYVGVLATGTNVVDLGAARDAGIVVTNVPGYATESVVEHVFALMLELSLAVADHAYAVAEGGWARARDFTFRLGPTRELAGLTLGIVGVGNIGARVAVVGHALGMRVVAAHQASMNDAHRRALAIEWTSVDDVFAQADVLTLHCPLRPDTEKLVDVRRLSLMKPTALLINTGRGGLVDEEALAQALFGGQIAGAALDVLSEEPPRAGHPLVGAPHCLITPHMAWATVQARHRLMAVVTQNIGAFLEGLAQNVVAAPASLKT